MFVTKLSHKEKIWQLLFVNAGSAFAGGWIGMHYFANPALRTLAASGVFLVLVSAAGELRLNQWRALKSILGT
jgi:hypothetical protein